MVTRFEYAQRMGSFRGAKATLKHCHWQLKQVNGKRNLQRWAMRQICLAGQELSRQRELLMALCERIKKEGIEQ